MSKHFKYKTFSDEESAAGDTDVIALLKKLQQQMAYLERKIDMLIGQSPDRPGQERHFSPSARSFGHPPRHERGEHNPRERSFAPGRRFDNPRGEERHGFSHRKKPFFGRRKERG